MQHLWRHLPWWIGDISQCREEARVTRLLPGFIITMILPPCHPRHEELQDYLPNLSILVQTSDQAWDQLNTVRRDLCHPCPLPEFPLLLPPCQDNERNQIWLRWMWSITVILKKVRNSVPYTVCPKYLRIFYTMFTICLMFSSRFIRISVVASIKEYKKDTVFCEYDMWRWWCCC